MRWSHKVIHKTETGANCARYFVQLNKLWLWINHANLCILSCVFLNACISVFQSFPYLHFLQINPFISRFLFCYCNIWSRLRTSNKVWSQQSEKCVFAEYFVRKKSGRKFQESNGEKCTTIPYQNRDHQIGTLTINASPTGPLRNSRHCDSDTFTVLSSRVDSYKYSFFPRTISEWNKVSQDVRSKPSVASFRSALLKVPGPVENNFWVMALRQ